MKLLATLATPLLLLASLVFAVPPSAQIDACKTSGHALRLQTVCDDSPEPAHGTTYLCAHLDGSVAFLTECEPHCPPGV
ncbi:hypothetical protein LshimejAT787_1200430 [Lyophyllum shimeji]|uniref:Uncharacterized protein n=1 Tax=Lyophyllum shimeji TaxID=47721 RepID=A0A9P3UPC4_LYOSH|nr:hypothetical protein LshimejAT787_1200430 [Lyophyllum shimeji]